MASSIKISTNQIIKMIDTLMETYAQFRFVSNIKSLLEVAFLKMATNYENTPIEVTAPEVKVQPKVAPVEAKEEKPVVKEETKFVSKETQEKFNIPTFSEEGDYYILSEEDTINLMQQGDKIAKNNLIEKWDQLDSYFSNNEIGKYAIILKKCSPRIVSKNILVVEANLQSIANKVRIKQNQKGFQVLVKKITGKEYLILSLTSQESIERVQKFSNLRQANKLPEVYPVEIKM